MSELASLPDGVLKLILSMVPLKYRLLRCSLVSRRFQHLAAAATAELHLWPWKPWAPRRFDGLLQWLGLYGHHVTRLMFFGPPQPLQQLPCPRLLHLNLTTGSVQLDPADGQPGVIQGCTRLTHLALACPVLDASHAAVGHWAAVGDSLSCLLDLQHLSVQADTCVLSAATLAGCKRLTHLGARLTADSLHHLSALTALQVLDLHLEGDMAVEQDGVPGYVLPPSLTRLVLLSRVHAGILSVAPTGLRELRLDCGADGPAEGPGSVLSGLARLQHLTSLRLLSPAWWPTGFNWPAPGPAYSAITASSGLVSLTVPLLGGIWSHMFPAGHTLPRLTSLLIYQDAYPADAPCYWDAASVSSLVSCCPNLHHIAGMHLQAGWHVYELQKLTALTGLDFLYDDNGNMLLTEWSLPGLALATQLRSLQCVLRGSCWTLEVLLPLARLTALESLELHDAYGCVDSLCYQSKTAQGPPVWLQLLIHCAAEPACQAAALRVLAEQLDEPHAAAAHRALTVDLQRQLGSQQQQVAQLDQLLVEQDELLAEQEQVTAQQAAQITEQAALIIGLQWQLAGQQQVAAEQAAQITGQSAHVAGLQWQLAGQRQAAQQQAQQIAGQAAQTAGLLGQLAKQQELATQQAAQIAGLQWQLAGQRQAAQQQAEQVAGLHGQLAKQQQLTTQQAAQIAGLQAQLQEVLRRLPAL